MYKPVILLGNGCRNNPALVEYLCGLGIPVLTTWMALDLVPEASPVFCGRPGLFGQRAANIIQQKADALYVFGARLDGEQVAYDYDRFAPNAEIYVFDVDRAELDKLPGARRWHKIQSDIAHQTIAFSYGRPDPRWLAWCIGLYQRFRPELDGTAGSDYFVDTFAFMHALSEATDENDLLAIGSSSGAVNAFLQSYKVKRGQRVTVCATIGAMGADIPMSLGGCIASQRRTIVVTGDGGFQLNTQELEVVRRLNLPITFFVFNNNGYNSIRVMQDARYQGRHVGCDPASGFTVPSIRGLAEAYGLAYTRLAIISYPRLMQNYLKSGPAIVEVPVDPSWQQLPRVMASTVNGQLRTDDMQDMTPKLDPAELRALMEWGS